MVNFLIVPLKSTNEVDLYKPLKTYIDSLAELSDDLRMEANEGLIELNKLRNKACCQPLDKSQSSLDLLTRYYDQLCAIETKLPITPTQNPVSFKWKDAFDKGSLFFSRASLTLNDSSFERAAVLFNCGALMSAVAATQQPNTDDEMKSVARIYTQSAGIFNRLKDTVLGLVQQEPTPDLMPDTLTALSSLMVAQAQEVYYEGAKTKFKLRPDMLLTVASQCADFYSDSQKLMTRDAVKGIWEKDWIPIVTAKSFAYGALAQFLAAEVAASGQKIGEQISRLKEAHRLMEKSNSSFKDVIPEASETIEKALRRANKDNDFIYHEKIPEFTTLPLLGKKPLATASITFPLSPRFKDLFESLVPVAVQSALSTFEGRKNEVVNLDVARMREYTQTMNACLAAMNLPAALDDVTKQEHLPESIREKSAKVKASGGINAIIGQINELPSLYRRNDEILNETSRLLKDEKENDDSLRNQFGAKWTRMASQNLTQPLLQELGKHRGFLQTAANTDMNLRAKFEENKRGIELLSMSENDLRSSLPGIGQAQGSLSSNLAITKLRELLAQVQEIKIERENIEKELKKIRFDMSNEFAKALAETGVVNEERMSTEKIQQLFKPLKEQLERSIQRQETVMCEIEQWNKKFEEERHGAGGAERENLLKQLATAYDTFFHLQGNLSEGHKFYSNLTANLVKVQQKVSDFCFARQTEKEDLMKQVQQNIVSGGSNAKSNHPPPRPPPPQLPPPPSAPPPIPPHTIVQAGNYQAAPAPQMPTMPMPPAQHQQPSPYQPYAPFSYGVPQQNAPTAGPFTPYPMQYPGTYPGAYPQQQFGAYPPPPHFGNPQQQGNVQHQQQGTNPFYQ